MSQYERVKLVLQETEKPLALHHIHAAIRERFSAFDSEAGISARIRDIRHDMERAGTGTVYTERVEGKSYLLYQVKTVAHAASGAL